VTAVAPLDDPSYDPVHKPVDGRVPAVVARWGAASQLRWFARFRDELTRRKLISEWDAFYCESAEHRGSCCDRCIEDWLDGYGYASGCCCKSESE
jgi:hypothetical protein